MTKYLRNSTHTGFTDNGTAISATKYDETLIDIFEESATRVASMQGLLFGSNPSDLADGKCYLVQNFYSDTEGGGDPFFWDANGEKGDHDGIEVVDPTHSTTPGNAGWWTSENTGTTGVFKRIDRPFITAKQAGATGDGVTDDTNAVLALLQTGGSLGKKIIFEESTYDLSGWVDTYSTITDDLHIEGESKDGVVINGPDSQTDFINYGNKISISNLTINDFKYVLSSTSTQNTYAYDCEVVNCARFISNTSIGSTYIGIAKRIEFYGQPNNTHAGSVRLCQIAGDNGALYVDISENIIRDIDMSGQSARIDAISIDIKDISASGYTAPLVGYGRVDNNKMENLVSDTGQRADGIIFFGFLSGSISNNQLHNIKSFSDTSTETYGINCRSRNTKISGNFLEDAGREAGIYTKGGDFINISITDNTVEYSDFEGERGIWSITDYPAISDNRISGTVIVGISVSYSDSSNTSENFIVKNNHALTTGSALIVVLRGGNNIVKSNYLESTGSQSSVVEINTNLDTNAGCLLDFISNTIVAENATMRGIFFDIDTGDIDTLNIIDNNVEVTDKFCEELTATGDINTLFISGNSYRGPESVPLRFVGFNISDLRLKGNGEGINDIIKGTDTIGTGGGSGNITYARPIQLSNEPYVGLEDIQVQVISDPNGSTVFYPDSITNTNFTITTDTAPSSSVNIAYKLDFQGPFTVST